MSTVDPTPPPSSSPERLKLLRDVSNRLFISLGVLMLVFIPSALVTYSFRTVIVGAVPMLAVVSGFFGGFVGLQKRLRQLSEEELMLMAQSWVYTLLSPMVGGILAGLTYILFISGLLSGDLFPNFQFDATEHAGQGLAKLFAISGLGPDYAKLIFWCFLAGYSERFATDVLGKFEGGAGRGQRAVVGKNQIRIGIQSSSSAFPLMVVRLERLSRFTPSETRPAPFFRR